MLVAVLRAPRPRGGRPRRLAARGSRGARRRSPGRAGAHAVAARRHARRRPVLLAAPRPSRSRCSATWPSSRATRRRSGFADRLQELTGYPREAFRAIRRHERLDIKHKRELYELDRPAAADAPSTSGSWACAGLHTIQAAVDVAEEIAASRARPRGPERAVNAGQGMSAPLRLREYRLLFSGQCVSNLGDWLDFIALTVLIAYVWEMGPSALAALSIAIAVPWIFVAPFAGVLGRPLAEEARPDRHGPRARRARGRAHRRSEPARAARPRLPQDERRDVLRARRRRRRSGSSSRSPSCTRRTRCRSS